MRLEVRDRQRLQAGKEIVAYVVLDVPGRADEDAAHQEPEDAAENADDEQHPAVHRKLPGGHTCRQIVHRVLEDRRRGEGNAGGDDYAANA